MADTLEWSERISGWYLADMRDKQYDARVRINRDADYIIFYPVYRLATYVTLPAPEDMSIDQLKDWAMNQFLLIRES